ncbi:hypothetical protein K458DRAFT_436616 [Lentithecium fluviatile CBS 122367]|uniref:Fibronectin type-III domain-containing protein n=1 Tax=Lentithecium fluviatile CBS 122367 TaxID=1168545 RepID=A0A6G1IH19_9PLEO|nr:hypothetical protein K458DRAFT_436616 [Lentithecium fluviatile CBS 122367]
MRFTILYSLLALAAGTTALALPSETPTITDPTAPLNGTIDLFFPSTSLHKRAGADGTLTYRWISARSFGAAYRIKDTSADSHQVYIETTVYDINDLAKYVLRCTNGNGAGSEIRCAEKTYTHGSTIVGIAPHVCVDIQLGSDQCTTGSTVLNPYR